ncbi:hypothetical protein [Subtercola endophyticus]|uniref:hypothetical protein n=1 Tax=Subtercola endophyticus TaxID=2895559 RepID=UPI001E3B713D|nr:hypothetical protein [Subtercola endophyticus]UFS58924.1 hypothetical protein LQ955_18335 [Subtercola endophyticus]
MTDARMPERYLVDRRVNRLTDAGFRAFVTATMWSVSNRTDGLIHPEDLPLIRGLNQNTLAEMLAVELCTRTDEAWLLVDFSTTQTSKHDLEVLDNMRQADREKKRRSRASKRESPSFSDSPGDGTGDVSPGQDRRGQARESEATPSTKKAAIEWPVAEIGKGRVAS